MTDNKKVKEADNKAAEKKIGIQPLGDDILTEPIHVKSKYEKRGIVMPEEEEKKKHIREYYDDHPYQARVRKIGPEYDGVIKVGDVVYFIGGDGHPLIYNDGDYLLLRSDRILGIKEF